MVASSVFLDPSNDNVPLAIEGAVGPAKPLDHVEQSGDGVWDEEESQALRQARKDVELTVSVDSVRVYLKQIGKVALLNAEQEVGLATQIEAGLYAAERMRRAEDVAEKLPPRLLRDLRWIVRDGKRAKNHLLEANLSPRRVAGQALHRPRRTTPGPDPGGQPGPDPRGGKVRPHQGLQVLHLCHLVDPPSDQPVDDRPGPHHPDSGTHGRGDQQTGRYPAQAGSGPGSRAHPGGGGQGDGHPSGEGAGASARRPGTHLAGSDRRRG